MGKRARANGIANAAVRQARRKLADRHPRAHRVSQAVYNTVIEMEQAGGPRGLSPGMEFDAALVVGCSMLASAVVKANGMPETNESVVRVAEYLAAVTKRTAVHFSLAELERFEEAADSDLSLVAGDDPV